MKIELTVNDKPTEFDEFLDEDEMGLPPFHFTLIELSQYVDGHINIVFNSELDVELDLFSDFSVCFEDIVNSVNFAKSRDYKKEKIWFCEQGSDFYLYYEVKGNVISLSYKRGTSTGTPNKDTPNFTITIDVLNYIQQWEGIFQKLKIIVEEKLHKKISMPF